LNLRLTRGAATNNNLGFAACLARGGIGDVDVRKAVVVPRIASVNIALTTGALPRRNVRPSGVGVHRRAIVATSAAIKRIAIINIHFTTVRNRGIIAVSPIRLAATRLNGASIISRNKRNRFAGNTRCDHMRGITTGGSEAARAIADAEKSAMSWEAFVNFTAGSRRTVAVCPFRIAIDDLASLVVTTESGMTGFNTAIRSDLAARN